jgi:hypothetical protein
MGGERRQKLANRGGQGLRKKEEGKQKRRATSDLVGEEGDNARVPSEKEGKLAVEMSFWKETFIRTREVRTWFCAD